MSGSSVASALAGIEADGGELFTSVGGTWSFCFLEEIASRCSVLPVVALCNTELEAVL